MVKKKIFFFLRRFRAWYSIQGAALPTTSRMQVGPMIPLSAQTPVQLLVSHLHRRMQVLVLGGNRARGLRMDGSYLFSFIAAIIVGCITIYHYYKRPLKLSEIGASEKNSRK
jgi:hypothetical protein